MSKQAMVANIQRFSLDDGSGIRTTVFFKGCPLYCLWCHNPECIEPKAELAFREELCILCGACARVCPKGAHSFADGEHRIDRSVCVSCGACAEVCPAGALDLCGALYSVDELERLVLRDLDFYERSGGGVTFSGGEPILQKEFLLELMPRLKEKGIHLALDTCGEVSSEAIQALMPYTDLFLYDIKCMDSALHETLTGRRNERILENLRMLLEAGSSVRIRMPLIAGKNDGDELIKKAAAWLRPYQDRVEVDLLKYHEMGVSKYPLYGRTVPDVSLSAPSEKHMKHCAAILDQQGIRAWLR